MNTIKKNEKQTNDTEGCQSNLEETSLVIINKYKLAEMLLKNCLRSQCLQPGPWVGDFFGRGFLWTLPPTKFGWVIIVILADEHGVTTHERLHASYQGLCT